MQGFSCEETTSNQNGASPASSVPMFPNTVTGGAEGWPQNAAPPPTWTNTYAGWTPPPPAPASPSHWVNTEKPQHHNDASFDNAAPWGYPPATQDPFNVFPPGAQEQMMLMDDNVARFDGITVLHGNPVQSFDDLFNFCNLPTQSGPPGLPPREQFHGEPDPASNFIGNLNPQSLLDSDIPIPCHLFGCFATFKRDSDRIRHEAAVHGINKATYLCHIVGCNKSQGVGYTRKDKLLSICGRNMEIWGM